MPGSPYINAIDEGWLECTRSDQWHTDINDQYTFDPVMLPDRGIIIL